ncbi:hypothetical protein [Paraburkholderia tropica]|uniref:hypothetical protein n=1 Tax=Paraburkholderia tropica TaxID=92647 RepID=UPI0007ED5C16|nr:hypothetical protein [Paraburkholderia tropica]OBR52317.1 hypothetical protein A6456_10460 [Paraburkholderia tropica]
MSALSINIGGQVTTVQIGNLPPAVQAQLTSAIATINTIQQSSLLQWAYGNIFQLVSATRDSNEAIVTASIVWPDGSAGTFITDVASTAFPGAIDAWHATYVNGAITHTVTQPTVTRDANGAVTAQPAITIT